MSIAEEIASPRVRWDLSALFKGMDDPKVEVTWRKLMSDADAYAAKYRGRISAQDLSAS